MDLKDIYDGNGNAVEKLIIKPYLYGLLLGIGHFAAYLVLNHKYCRLLAKAAAENIEKK